MIRMCLQSVQLTTRNDSTETKGTQTRGVLQGSTLSPSLFNFFMDTFPSYLRQRATNERNTWSVLLYADDVKLQTQNRNEMQDLLNWSTEWSKNMEMTWSISKCTSMMPTTEKTALTLDGHELQRTNEVEYLGISMNCYSITETKQIYRINKGKEMVRMLTNINVTYEMMKPKLIRDICSTFIYPVATYAIPLVPQSETLNAAWRTLEIMILKLVLGFFTQRHKRKLRKIAQLTSLNELTSIRLHSLESRLKQQMAMNENIQEYSEDVVSLQKYRIKIKSPPNINKKQLQGNMNRFFENHRYRIPSLKLGQNQPALIHLKGEYLVQAVRWYIGTFTRSPSKCKIRGGIAAQEAWNTVKKILEKTKWNDDELNALQMAIDLLMEVQPNTWQNKVEPEQACKRARKS